MTKYLVTGGSGFIGSAVVKRLVRDGHAVTVLDNNSRGMDARLEGVLEQITFIQGDVRDPQTVIDAARGVESILHLAAVNGTENFYRQPKLVLDVGVRGMLAVLDACQANAIRDLMVFSSSEVYQTPPVVPTPETVPLVVPDVMNPRYSYGGGKIISELLAINYGRSDFDRVTVVRPHNVYGPDMGWEHVLPQFILRAYDQIQACPEGPVPFEIQGDGTQTRAFIHIDDFTDGLMAVLQRGEHLNIYHIGTGEELEIREIARRIVGKMGREARLITGDEAQGGTPRRCPDITKLRQLGFAPRVSFDQGLAEVVDWYVAHQDLRRHASSGLPQLMAKE